MEHHEPLLPPTSSSQEDTSSQSNSNNNAQSTNGHDNTHHRGLTRVVHFGASALDQRVQAVHQQQIHHSHSSGAVYHSPAIPVTAPSATRHSFQPGAPSGPAHIPPSSRLRKTSPARSSLDVRRPSPGRAGVSLTSGEPMTRSKAKFVALPAASSCPDNFKIEEVDEEAEIAAMLASELGPDGETVQHSSRDEVRGRIRVFCVAEGLDLPLMMAMLRASVTPQDGQGASSQGNYTSQSRNDETDAPPAGSSNGGGGIGLMGSGQPSSGNLVGTGGSNHWGPSGVSRQGYASGVVSGAATPSHRAAEASGGGAGPFFQNPLDAMAVSNLVYSWQEYPEAVYTRIIVRGSDNQYGDVFLFEYGVVAAWGLTEELEQQVLALLARPCSQQPMAGRDLEMTITDELEYVYSAHSAPHIQNDCITINKRQAADHQVKLAISHALAQCSKLGVYEQRVMTLVGEVRHLPQDLAQYGRVRLSRKQVTQLMGKVFIQKSNLNLLSSVLDTPEFFWRAPDSLQALYERACEYLELSTRIDLVNARFEVLQRMLDLWRSHSNHRHLSRLDFIIILLIVVEVALAFADVIALLAKKYY